MKKIHRLLQRQLKKAELSKEHQDLIKPLLSQINEAYYSFDNDLGHLENILELSSQELFDLNRRLQSNVEDISKKLSRVVNNIQEVIFEIDGQGHWKYLNPAWEKLSGVNIEDSLNKKADNYLLDRHSKNNKYVEHFQKSPFQSVNQNIELLTRGNVVKVCDFSIKKIFNSNGEFEGCIGTIIDITELKKIENELINAKENEIKANKAKDTFISTVCHEIRTPLTAINGISKLLSIDDEAASNSENFNALYTSSEYLMQLVNNLLQMNKIEFGAVEIEKEQFNFYELIQHIRDLFSNKAIDKGLKFSIVIAQDIPKFLIGDHIKILQILSNLITNAIKFTETGSVTLAITRQSTAENEIQLNFKVIDTGVGISLEYQDTIFDSFTQIKENRNQTHLGSGLGLSICKNLLELMESKLNLKSHPSKGSTFEFDLRLEIGHEKIKNGYPSDSNNYKDLVGKRVLVAEDNDFNALTIQRFFDKWQISYDIVADGAEALAAVESNQYDLILMDLQMPYMTGFDASKEIRKSTDVQNRSIPIYAMSASIDDDTIKKVYAHGMNGHISKPFNPRSLYNQLKELIGVN